MRVWGSTCGRLAVVAALVLCGSRAAAAHGMDYAQRGAGEVRLVFRYTSGPPMIGAAYDVFA